MIKYISASCALKVIVSSVLHNDADLIAALRAPVLPFKV